MPDRGGAEPRSTRSTCAASPTATATASATWPASAARLPYLADLGVDAIWFNPWYPSPMADARLRRGRLPRHRPGLRHPGRGRGADRRRRTRSASGSIIDIVPNHCSDQHPWFRRGARGRARARPSGTGSGSGRAAARTASCRRTTGSRSSAAPPGPGRRPGRHAGEWYLHLFAPEQPDFNWANPRGARGVRGRPAVLVRPRRRRRPHRLGRAAGQGPGAARRRRRAGPHPYTDRDEVHEIYRAWRRIADEYPEPGADRRGLAARHRSGSPATCARTSCTPRSTSTSCAAPGTPPSCAR